MYLPAAIPIVVLLLAFPLAAQDDHSRESDGPETGMWVYHVLYPEGLMGEYTYALRKDSLGGASVVLVRRSFIADGRLVEQKSAFYADSFKPIRSETDGAMMVDLAFDEGQVTGRTRAPGGDTRNIDLTAPEGTILPWMYQEAVARMPLRTGYEERLTVVNYAGELEPLLVRVLGDTSIAVPAGEFEVFEVSVTGETDRWTGWHRKTPPHIMIREDAPGSQVSARLAAVLPEGQSVTALAARAGLPAAQVLGRAARPDDAEAVSNLLLRLKEAWRDRDAEAVAALYADDAEYVNAFGVAIRGAAELRKFLAWTFSHEQPTDPLENGSRRSLSTRYLGEDLVLLHEVGRPRDGGLVEAGEPRVHNSYLLERRGAEWRIVHHVTAAFVPPE